MPVGFLLAAVNTVARAARMTAERATTATGLAVTRAVPWAVGGVTLGRVTTIARPAKGTVADGLVEFRLLVRRQQGPRLSQMCRDALLNLFPQRSNPLTLRRDRLHVRLVRFPQSGELLALGGKLLPQLA